MPAPTLLLWLTADDDGGGADSSTLIEALLHEAPGWLRVIIGVLLALATVLGAYAALFRRRGADEGDRIEQFLDKAEHDLAESRATISRLELELAASRRSVSELEGTVRTLRELLEERHHIHHEEGSS